MRGGEKHAVSGRDQRQSRQLTSTSAGDKCLLMEEGRCFGAKAYLKGVGSLRRRTLLGLLMVLMALLA